MCVCVLGMRLTCICPEIDLNGLGQALSRPLNCWICGDHYIDLSCQPLIFRLIHSPQRFHNKPNHLIRSHGLYPYYQWLALVVSVARMPKKEYKGI